MHIVVADDQSLIRELVGARLSHMFPGSTIVEALDASDALQKAKIHRPALITLDLHMQGLGTFEAARQIKTFLPKSKIAILTGSADAKLALRSRDQKLNGYLLKGDPAEEFTYAIDTIMKGGCYIPPSLSPILLDPQLASRSRYNTLTLRELEVLTLLFGQSLTVRECADTLGIADKTVESHRNTIGKKLNNPTRSQLTFFCYEMKLVSESQLRLPQPAHFQQDHAQLLAS